MTILLIYLAGVVAAWFLIAWHNDKYESDINLAFTLLSWLIPIFAIIIEVVEHMPNPTLKIFKRKNIWEYGWVKDRWARRHIKNGNVQFILWQAGQQGRIDDVWADFDKSWWAYFTTKTSTDETNKNNP